MTESNAEPAATSHQGPGPGPGVVLVTGAAGAVGRVIGPALIHAGHTVRAMDLQPTPWATDAIVGDGNDPDLWDQALQNVRVIVHLAAWAREGTDLTDLLGPNYVMPRRLVQRAAAARTVQRLILASTVQVYSGTRPALDRAESLEDVAPTNDYALSKVWLEHLGEWSARAQLVGARSPHRLVCTRRT